jgi:hypothetical protein
MTQLLADITLYEKRFDTRIWGGEATGAYTIKFESELIDNIIYLENFPYSFFFRGKNFPHRRSNVHVAASTT